MAKNFKKKVNKYSQDKSEFQNHIILCEGETEINYFNIIKKLSRGKIVKIKDIKKMDKFNLTLGSLKSMVSSYEKKQEQNNKPVPSGTKYWFVFDIDEKTESLKSIKKLSDEINESKLNYSITYTNPTFEYWMLLHIAGSKRKSGKKSIEKEFKDFAKNEKKPYNNWFKNVQQSLNNDFILEKISKAKEISMNEFKESGIESSRNFTNIHELINELIEI